MNADFMEVKQLLGGAVGGLHTMLDEHFGISIVEYMAAGQQGSSETGSVNCFCVVGTSEEEGQQDFAGNAAVAEAKLLLIPDRATDMLGTVHCPPKQLALLTTRWPARLFSPLRGTAWRLGLLVHPMPCHPPAAWWVCPCLLKYLTSPQSMQTPLIAQLHRHSMLGLPQASSPSQMTPGAHAQTSSRMSQCRAGCSQWATCAPRCRIMLTPSLMCCACSRLSGSRWLRQPASEPCAAACIFSLSLPGAPCILFDWPVAAQSVHQRHLCCPCESGSGLQGALRAKIQCASTAAGGQPGFQISTLSRHSCLH